MLEDFDPHTIEDESLRQVVITLMNLVETLSTKVKEQAEEIQRLRDEVNRLKGEQGKPKIKANKAALALSSEKERRKPKAHHKAKKQGQVRIDRVEIVKVDQQRLPHDAQGVWLPRCHSARSCLSQREILLTQQKKNLSG
jgi:hypothetical protein